MPVSSADAILKRARQMEIARQTASIRVDMANVESLSRRIDTLEGKFNVLMERMESFIDANRAEMGIVHQKMLGEMAEWRSTAEMADKLGYRQEYMSRKVAELKTNRLVVEKRSGKKIFYRVANAT